MLRPFTLSAPCPSSSQNLWILQLPYVKPFVCNRTSRELIPHSLRSCGKWVIPKARQPKPASACNSPNKKQICKPPSSPPIQAAVFAVLAIYLPQFHNFARPSRPSRITPPPTSSSPSLFVNWGIRKNPRKNFKRQLPATQN